MSGLVCLCVCVCCVCLCVCVCYELHISSLPLQNIGDEYPCVEELSHEAAQNVLFSILCGLMVALAYHLSRSASDPSVLW